MIGTSAHDALKRRTSLAQALKALRRLRGLRRVDVAQAMGMPLRSYEHFESGAGRLNVERIHQFAHILNVDGYAILTAIDIGSPAFAVRSAENKLGTITVMALQKFDAAAGEQIARLTPGELIAALRQAFETLASQAQERDAFAKRWMAETGLSPPAPKPGAEEDEPKA